MDLAASPTVWNPSNQPLCQVAMSSKKKKKHSSLAAQIGLEDDSGMDCFFSWDGKCKPAHNI